MDKKTLKIELVPDGCWYFNLRSILTKEQWNYIKAEVKKRSGGKCAICGRRTPYLDAHERWSYDEKNCVQKLEEVIAVCKDCHSVIHIGRTQLKGDEKRTEEHYMRVNGATYAEYRQALKEANQDHIRRNKISEWKTDISYIRVFAGENDKI